METDFPLPSSPPKINTSNQSGLKIVLTLRLVLAPFDQLLFSKGVTNRSGKAQLLLTNAAVRQVPLYAERHPKSDTYPTKQLPISYESYCLLLLFQQPSSTSTFISNLLFSLVIKLRKVAKERPKLYKHDGESSKLIELDAV